QNAIALAVDASGNLYVATSATDRESSGTLIKFAAGSTTPSAIPTGPKRFNPKALVVDTNGNLFAAGAGSVVKVTPGSVATSAILGLSGYSPSALAVDRGGNLYVAANTNRQGNNYG